MQGRRMQDMKSMQSWWKARGQAIRHATLAHLQRLGLKWQEAELLRCECVCTRREIYCTHNLWLLAGEILPRFGGCVRETSRGWEHLKNTINAWISNPI